MASKTTICGICDLRHITKPALVWCSECDEGLCVECKEHHGLSKGTRSHNTVTISEYEKLPSSVLEVTNFCSEHNEKYQIYCKKHELPCCRRCVIETHNECKDITALDDVISDVKTSNAFFEIEHMLVEVCENIQRILEDRRKNLERLETERQRIEKEIQQTRISVNAHLDKLQASIMAELFEAEAKERTKISRLLQSLENKANEIGKYQENLANIKQHASELQIFLALKQMERDVEEKDKFVNKIINSDKLSRVSLSCKINDCLQRALNDIKEFGDIMIKTNASDIAIVRKKNIQAQIIVPQIPLKSIQNISCKLQKTINTNLDNITGCTLLPDGRMVFSGKCSVKAFKSDGSKDFKIRLPGTTCGMTYIHANNTIAVTCEEEDDQMISIIDVEGRKVKKKIPMSTSNNGIVSKHNTLFYCAGDHGVRMINLANNSISNIVKGDINSLAYIAIFGDKLYYTNFNTYTVICCDLNGKKQWKFIDNTLLSGPLGLSVDNEGNIFVVGYSSDNVVVISPDGQQHRELLSGMDGLQCPQVLYYDRSSNKLLVANGNNTAFLFNVERL